MSIHVRCPECGTELRVPASMSGKRGKCPKCSATISIREEPKLPVAKPLAPQPQQVPPGSAKPPARTPPNPASHAKPPIVSHATAATPAVSEVPAFAADRTRRGKGVSLAVLLAAGLGAVAMLAVVVGAAWYLTRPSVDVANRSTDEADRPTASLDTLPAGPNENARPGDAPSNPTGASGDDNGETVHQPPDTLSLPAGATGEDAERVALAPAPDPVDAGGTASPSSSDSNAAQLMEELIAVSNQMADALTKVTDEATAREAAPQVQPIIDRQNELLKKLAALKITMPSEEFELVQAKYGERIKDAAQRAVTERFRVLGDLGLVVAWGEGLLANAAATPPSNTPPRTELADQQGFAKALDEYLAAQQHLSDVLATIRDESSARSARSALQQATVEYEQAVRKFFAGMITASAASQNVLAERGMKMMEATDRLLGEVERVAGSPGKEAVQQELVYLINVPVRVAPNARLRAKAEQEAQQWLQQFGLD